MFTISRLLSSLIWYDVVDNSSGLIQLSYYNGKNNVNRY